MNQYCVGCGEDITCMQVRESRYDHGDLCLACFTLESSYGDFIARYWDEFSSDYPADVLEWQTK